MLEAAERLRGLIKGLIKNASLGFGQISEGRRRRRAG